jgi:hypothetical protein
MPEKVAGAPERQLLEDSEFESKRRSAQPDNLT